LYFYYLVKRPFKGRARFNSGERGEDSRDLEILQKRAKQKKRKRKEKKRRNTNLARAVSMIDDRAEGRQIHQGRSRRGLVSFVFPIESAFLAKLPRCIEKPAGASNFCVCDVWMEAARIVALGLRSNIYLASIVKVMSGNYGKFARTLTGD